MCKLFWFICRIRNIMNINIVVVFVYLLVCIFLMVIFYGNVFFVIFEFWFDIF